MTEHTPDPLAQTVTAQVLELHTHLQQSGMLTPPVPTVSEAQAHRAAADLRAALAGTVETLARAPQGSPLAHFSNALLYGGMIAAELQCIEPCAVACLTALSVWALEFRREVLGDAAADDLDALDDDAQAVPFILQRVDPRERGAALGATVILDAVYVAVTDPALTRADYAQALDGAARLMHMFSVFDDTPSAAQA